MEGRRGSKWGGGGGGGEVTWCVKWGGGGMGIFKNFLSGCELQKLKKGTWFPLFAWFISWNAQKLC